LLCGTFNFANVVTAEIWADGNIKAIDPDGQILNASPFTGGSGLSARRSTLTTFVTGSDESPLMLGLGPGRPTSFATQPDHSCLQGAYP
jgi:hypothetical protein